MATAYLTDEEFRVCTKMPPEDLDALELRRPGFIRARLLMRSAEINGRLAKRYAVPFAAPYPEIVTLWLTGIVTLDGYEALGFSPASEQDGRIVEGAKSAWDALKEAADSEEGLYDLPLRANTSASGIERGGPLAYSEAGPYDWMARQSEAVRNG